MLIDGTPGSLTLVLLAVHHVVPPFDAILVPDTGWLPDQADRDLDRLARLATTVGMRLIRAQTGPTGREALDGVIMPLPLHTLTADGHPGRLPHGCAHRQGVALSSAVRRLLGYPRPQPLPEGVVAECATGTTLDHTHAPDPTGPPYVRFRRPLTALGWTEADCVALLAHHDLPTEVELSCIACPQRSNPRWRRLRRSEPQAFTEAIGIDAAVRHAHPDPALRGRPPGTTFYLHPDRVPLEQADLDAHSATDRSGCVPWRCLGAQGSRTDANGGSR
ncbi:hypothetical protein GCM10027590_68540 [Nocardiopsis nanhaiensis]